MSEWPDAIVLVALTLAALLFLVEVALPTFGVAGFSALALAALAFAAAADQNEAWWPLVLVVAGVSLWAVLLFARKTALWAQATAVALFAAGGVSYGVLAGEPATVALAVVGATALPLAFRPLLRATIRLQELPPQTGMEALVGSTGTVVHWDNGSGSVRVAGSLWTARSRAGLSPGDEVEVVGYDGLTMDVTLRRRRHRSLASS